MGQIITPPPKCEHIIYYWDESKPNITLPGLVRYFIEERERERSEIELRRNTYQAPLRGAQLKEYVTNIRTALHSERAREKRERYNATVLKYVLSPFQSNPILSVLLIKTLFFNLFL